MIIWTLQIVWFSSPIPCDGFTFVDISTILGLKVHRGSSKVITNSGLFSTKPITMD